MAPTLNAGDDILVDLGDAAERLRDGIYVLRIDDALVVKRIALNPIGPAGDGSVRQSGLSGLARLALDEINCIGRVIWAGRKVV